MSALPFIAMGILLNVLAQVVIKMGMSRIGYFDVSIANAGSVTLQVIRSPLIIGGISCYVFSVVMWLVTLSRVDVSFAYPLTSLGYILTAFAGYYFLGENITTLRIVGIMVIILGVYLVSRS